MKSHIAARNKNLSDYYKQGKGRPTKPEPVSEKFGTGKKVSEPVSEKFGTGKNSQNQCR